MADDCLRIIQELVVVVNGNDVLKLFLRISIFLVEKQSMFVVFSMVCHGWWLMIGYALWRLLATDD